MPQLSKRIPGAPTPFKLTPFDPVGDSANVFSDAMRTVLAGMNVKTGTPGDSADKGFFPQASDLDNGNANLLDWCDHGLWLATDANGGGPTRDYTGSFVYQEGHEANWKPAYFYRGNLIFRNVGETADLPAVSAPAWFRGGSIDLTPNSADGRYKAQFRLKPNTTYTLSFYVKKLASGAFRFRVGTGTNAGFGDGTWGTEPQASNLANILVDDSLAPPNVWTRVSATFTTSASGYVWVMWGGWTSWPSSLPLRLAFPQLEEGGTATAWTPSRYWRYVEYPAPFDIDFTVTHSAGSDGFYLYQALPGSVYAHRFDVRPDWPNTTGDAPQYDRINTTSPTSSESTARRPGSIGSGGQYYNPMWEWSHTMISNLGGELYASTRRSSGNPYRIKGQVRGVWVRHTSLGGGGTIWADTDAVSGPGHRKFVAFRLTDTGSNNFRLKFASMLMLPGVQPDSSFYASAGSISDALIRPNAPYVQAVLTVNLQRNADVFIDGAGNEQGFVLNFFQGNTYQDVLAVADFVDSLHAADDGSVYPRWGMLVPNANVFYEIAGGFGPKFVTYWPGAGRGFHTCGHWSGSIEPGYAPILYQEVVLGYRQVDAGRKYPSPLYAARNDSVAANRGRLANFYVALSGSVAANEGDTVNGGDGTDYYYADYRGGNVEHLMLLVKP